MRPTGNLKITPGSRPGAFVATLDGQDISGLVADATITFDPRSLPRAELTVVAVETECEGKVGLYLKPGTAELLECFGWTPPGSPGPRVFTSEDIETTAQALWVYWHRGTRWEAEGWLAQPAHEQQAYRDKARAALRSLGTVPDNTGPVEVADQITRDSNPVGDAIHKHGLSAVVRMSPQERAELRSALAAADRSEEA